MQTIFMPHGKHTNESPWPVTEIDLDRYTFFTVRFGSIYCIYILLHRALALYVTSIANTAIGGGGERRKATK
jgi:hypothetical protein